MNWQEVIAHPGLQNLPFKIELNEWGQIVMSPVKLAHSAYQGTISELLRALRKDGRILPECAIWTRKGTKAADVAWFSDERWQMVKGQAEASIAPELCVEVSSASNTGKELREKRKLYFEQGAQEVWLCNQHGKIEFFNPQGKLANSILFLDFPTQVEI